MRNSKQLAILNFIFVVLNLTWILIIDRQKLFGKSIYDTFIGNWTYLTPHKYTFFIWSLVSICLIITHGAFINSLKNAETSDHISEKVNNTGFLIMLNQVLLGMSMVTKLNDNIEISLLFTFGTLITLLTINKRLRIFRNPGQSIVDYISRISYGLYTGWLIYVALFNSASYLYTLIDVSMYSKFMISILSASTLFAIILIKSFKRKLPSYIFGYSFGLMGAYSNVYEGSYTPDYANEFLIIFQLLVFIMIGSCVYITLQGLKNKKEIQSESLN